MRAQLQLPPAGPLIRRGAAHRHRGEIDDAIRCYGAAHDADPHNPTPLLALGAMHLAAGRAGTAEPLLRHCCALAPRDAEARHAWGLAQLLLCQSQSAYHTLQAAHALDDRNTLCAVHLADAADALDTTVEILAQLQRERARSPANTAVLTGIAAALSHLGRRDEALDHLEAATLLQPDNAVAAAMFADLLARSTRQAEAEPALRRALLLDPANDDATMALSVVLMRLHRYAESVTLLRSLLARTSEPVGPLCNLATALCALGEQDEAVACARAAIAAAPAHPAPRRALCNTLPYHPSATGRSLLDAARACATRQPDARLPPCGNDRAPGRRLRIGLLSGSLRAHPVGWLTVAAFEHLDPSAFELICLAPHAPADALGRRFAAIAAAWDDTGALDDRQLAERARTLQLDIVIDLGGYGDLGRMPALAHRLAPVQIKWVGMQNHSSGLPEMDWFITDRWETPPDLAPLYSERLMVMPDGYVCYAPPPDAPDVAASPAQRDGAVTFGCYNNIAKITPQVIATWSRILHAVPDARLILKAHQLNNADTRGALLHRFTNHGIVPTRIFLRGSSPHRELLRQYADIDIVLDPFPYSGGLTTCEALWMGVPTLTMPGDTFASRHTASHMSNIGLPAWVVANEDAYVAAAIGHAADIAALAALRASLRDRTRRSPLCDAPRFAEALAQRLRAAWQDWCGSAGAGPVLHH